jgi:hydroxymethylglutaryl-CoA synthase
MAGLIAYGTYVPHHRLRRSEIAAVLGEGGGKGTRAVAGYDEDATSMGVEAAREALRGLPNDVRPQRLLLATTNPPYLDKTNANVVHAALSLDPRALAVDVIGSVRSGVGALLMAAESPMPTLVVLSDVRTGLPGGADEREGGDAAAALVFGEGAPAIAEVVAHASATEEFLDRWRLPGAASSRVHRPDASRAPGRRRRHRGHLHHRPPGLQPLPTGDRGDRRLRRRRPLPLRADRRQRRSWPSATGSR